MLLKTYIFFLPRDQSMSSKGGSKAKQRPSLTKGIFTQFVRQAADPLLRIPDLDKRGLSLEIPDLDNRDIDNLSDQIKKVVARNKKLEKKHIFDPIIFPANWFYVDS